MARAPAGREAERARARHARARRAPGPTSDQAKPTRNNRGPLGATRHDLSITAPAAPAAQGPGFTVAGKLNAGCFLRGGLDEGDALAIVKMLDGEGVDLLEISGGRYESGASFGHATPDAGEREAYFLAFARQARAVFRAPILLTGGLRSKRAMTAALAEGAADLMGLARPMALVPDYPRRLLADEALPAIQSRRLGVPKLESAAELAWYYAQLARLGRGLDPDRHASPARALAAYLASDAWEGARQRARRYLASLTCPAQRLLPGARLNGK